MRGSVERCTLGVGHGFKNWTEPTGHGFDLVNWIGKVVKPELDR